MPKKFRKTVIAILILGLTVSLIRLIITPTARIGFWGIGLPAPMQMFIGETTHINIKYPQSWTAFETPQGSHGDKEIIAVFQVPGRSWPIVLISRKAISDKNIMEVVNWGEGKRKVLEEYHQNILDKYNIADKEGLFREFKFKDSNLLGKIEVICQDYYLIDEQFGYSVLFCAEYDQWDLVESVFLQMFTTFKIVR